MRAIARIDEMCVAIDEAGRDPSAFAIDPLLGLERGRLRRLAASKTRRVCSAEKAMPSQKASTASASPSAAIAGSISRQTVSI